MWVDLWRQGSVVEPRLWLQLVKMAAPTPAPCKSFLKFNFSIYWGFFIQRKVRVLCFALPVFYLKRQISFFYIIVHFCLFLYFKHRVRAEAWAVELEPPLFFTAKAKKGGSGSTTLDPVWRFCSCLHITTRRRQYCATRHFWLKSDFPNLDFWILTLNKAIRLTTTKIWAESRSQWDSKSPEPVQKGPAQQHWTRGSQLILKF